MKTKSINDIINEAWKEAEKQNYKKAIEILEQSLNEFTENQEMILLELAKLYFEAGEDLKALERFMICYNYSKNEEILKFLLYCYYEPNIEEYKKIYNDTQCVKKYKYFYGELLDFKDINIKILWHDEKKIIYYSSNEILKIEFNIENLDKSSLRDQIIILINEFNFNKVLECEETTKKDSNYLTSEIPMYLYYDEENFSIASQLMEFQKIIEKKRIAIIVGEKQLKEFFDDTQVLFPTYIIGSNISKYRGIIENCVGEMNAHYTECKKRIKEYYENNSLEILENIKNKSPKILFITTRFSTAIQYHIRDCMQVAEGMGLKTGLVTEKSDIHRTTPASQFELIYKLKPDIIFCIDHFKFEFEDIPREIVWINWIQDPLPHIMNKNTPSKLLERDIVLNHLYTWDEFEKLNYPKERLFDAPIPSNPTIYKPYEISNEEKEKYSCDICFVCHAADFEGELNSFLERIQDDIIRGYLRRIAYEYYDIADRDGMIYYSNKEFKNFSLKLLNSWKVTIDEYILDEFVEEMRMWLNQRVFRQVLVNWLIDAGYENIKLWGNGWTKHEKYKKYAMGPAQNGEQLSKIYQCSKINVGNNIVATVVARAWESLLSGGFYMSNYIPPENDITDIRKILSEDEFVMFYDKEDFLSKIEYYLEHDDKRLEMIKKGRKCTLERMTFEALMKKTIDNVQNYYKGGI